MVGDEKLVSVTKVEHKLDLLGGILGPTDYMAGIWRDGARRIDDYSFKDETLYLGSRRSKKQVKVYNKSKEQGVRNTNWTRIEQTVKYRPAEKKPLKDLFTMSAIDAFDGLHMIKADENAMNTILQPYGVMAIPGSMFKTLKQLARKNRLKVLNELEVQGHLDKLSNKYKKICTQWLWASLKSSSTIPV